MARLRRGRLEVDGMTREERRHAADGVDRERAPVGEVTRTRDTYDRPAAPELATQLEAATRGGGDRGRRAQVERHYSAASTGAPVR
jgi:hypothetical protein